MGVADVIAVRPNRIQAGRRILPGDLIPARRELSRADRGPGPEQAGRDGAVLIIQPRSEPVAALRDVLVGNSARVVAPSVSIGVTDKGVVPGTWRTSAIRLELDTDPMGSLT
jgi:hypothetical protein